VRKKGAKREGRRETTEDNAERSLQQAWMETRTEKCSVVVVVPAEEGQMY
jgi:hypothetical protein